MSEAIDKLAAELSNLPADEWTRLDELRIASQEKEDTLEQAPVSEVADRLAEIERVAARINAAETEPTASPMKAREKAVEKI